MKYVDELPGRDPNRFIWNESRLVVGIAHLGLEIEPPLTRDESTAVIGMLNGERPETPEEAELRMNLVMSREYARAGTEIDQRLLDVNNIKKAIMEGSDVIQKIILNSVVEV